MKIETIKKKIKILEEEHLIHNGMTISQCGYPICRDRDERARLRKKLEGTK